VPAEACLTLDGFAVHDDFLTAAHSAALLEALQQRCRGGQFNAARIGAGAVTARHGELRGDSTCWLNAPFEACETDLLARLETLRSTLNELTLLGLFDTELHYAWYAPGMRYARHVDQPQGRDQRAVSFVLYLNAGWLPQHGGSLRLFLDSATVQDVAPLAGRLVYFLAEGREHEVLPAVRDRFSISGWFCRRE
jgi:SM-20-related protein